jgi:enamine deaminase RidA (YjgF/YER057c/UK114 family)
VKRQHINYGTQFENDGAFSRAVVQEPFCFVSGTTGYDYAAMQLPTGFTDQTINCLNTVARSLVDAGFQFEDIIRATYILADMDNAELLFKIIQPRFASIKPAIQLFEARLYRREMQVSIDVIACRCKL